MKKLILFFTFISLNLFADVTKADLDLLELNEEDMKEILATSDDKDLEIVETQLATELPELGELEDSVELKAAAPTKEPVQKPVKRDFSKKKPGNKAVGGSAPIFQ